MKSEDLEKAILRLFLLQKIRTESGEQSQRGNALSRRFSFTLFCFRIGSLRVHVTIYVYTFSIYYVCRTRVRACI